MGKGLEKRSDWHCVLEANLEQLAALGAEFDLSPALEHYRQVLVVFLGGETERLLELCAASGAFAIEAPVLPLAVRLRLEILTNTMEAKALAQISLPPSSDPWSGEIAMLLAAAWERLERFPEAIDFYKKAMRLFLKHGLKGKSLRARFNGTTLLGHMDPARKLMKEYYFLYREARKLRQHTVMSAALLNLSREYQRVGALRMALKFANRAVAVCGPDLHGQTYYLAVAHRAHVFQVLGRIAEAKLDLEEARTASFPSVQGACAMLERMFGEKESHSPQQGPLLRTWRERAADAGVGAKFSANEEKLLQFIAAKPRDKFDLVEHLFGAAIDSFVAENRLKNLVHRIRKKAPGLLVFAEGIYSLSERDILPRRKSG